MSIFSQTAFFHSCVTHQAFGVFVSFISNQQTIPFLHIWIIEQELSRILSQELYNSKMPQIIQC